MFTLQSAAFVARYQSYEDQRRVSYILNRDHHDIFVVKKARELLFDGYQHGMDEISMSLGITSDRFGWFSQVCSKLFSSETFSV